jgi:hypothetical protein
VGSRFRRRPLSHIVSLIGKWRQRIMSKDGFVHQAQCRIACKNVVPER